MTKILTAKIKSFALSEAGFDLVGISAASLSSKHERAVESWVSEGRAGTMAYMERDPGRRAHPESSLASARSVISLAVNYYHPEDPKPSVAVGKIAKYAYGRDYHKVIEKKLKKLGQFILETGGKGTEVKSYVDTGPILEKAFAQEAGLGFFGKNTNLITRNFGSWVFLASLITNLELEADAPHMGGCGSCRICIDACPTDALLGDGSLDARRCISYLTIETKDAEHPKELQAGIGEWVFGCDICQDVCPYNFRAKTTRHEELYPPSTRSEKRELAQDSAPSGLRGTWLDLDKLEAIKTDEEFQSAFQGSPLKRSKRLGLLRNARTVRMNVKNHLSR